MNIEPIILEGESVKLAPLESKHLDELWKVAANESLWLWTANVIKSKAHLQSYIATALAEEDAKTSLPFVTIEKSSNEIVGSTRFGNIDAKNRRAEIGWTWINPKWQRSSVNTESKLLMLTHAFEIWRCIRVELKTDALNNQSRSAIARLGAKEEGILRRHLITNAGRFRDTVYFSIIDSEWRTVKADLNAKLESRR